MADSSPLAGLLDRAGKVFSLAGKLGRAYQEEHQGQDGQVDPASWDRHVPTFNEFCAALLELRDAMQNPPDGFDPVAKPLLEAARIAKGIRDAMRRPDGRKFAAHLDFFPDLISVCADGLRAVKGVTRAQRLDDLLAFADGTAASIPLGINTTPATPKPPIQFVEAAARDIPRIMANVPPRHDNAIQLIASSLAKRLQDAGHTLAAAHWAIHEAVRAGRLRPGLIEHELPSFGRRVGGTMRHLGGPDDRRIEWTGGRKVIVAIPEGRPAPFEAFKVTATELLWAWWSSAAVESPKQGAPTVELQAACFDEIGRTLEALAERLLNLDISEATAEAGRAAYRPGGEPAEAANASSAESPTGFLGGAALADALGVHATQRDAFFQRLMRQRMSLGDDCWHEVRDPRPNSPRFLYRVDSPQLRDLAAGYRNPKPA